MTNTHAQRVAEIAQALPTIQIQVPGSSGRSYTVTIPRSGAPAWCSCPAYRWQKIPAASRTCKHLEALRSRFN